LKYEPLVREAANTPVILNFSTKLEYSDINNNLYAYITEFSGSADLQLDQISIFNTETNTTIYTPDNITYNYNLNEGIFNINIPDLNKDTSRVTIKIIAKFENDDNLILDFILHYN